MIPTISLNDGHDIPQLGFGVFRVEVDATERIVSEALEVGYRHIDTAAAYRNEEGVGKAIAASGIPRDELFITTKLWNDKHENSAAHVGMDASLEALGLDYVDLYLIHWPAPWKKKYVEAWGAMAEMRDAGQARSIGVANFHEDHLENIIRETGVVPALNQIELHPAFSQTELRAVNDRLGIRTESWGPLGQGKYDLLDREPVRATADAHGVTPAQAVLRWHIQHGLIVIPKSNSKARMAQNADLFGFELSDEEMASINGLDEGMRVGAHPETIS